MENNYDFSEILIEFNKINKFEHQKSPSTVLFSSKEDEFVSFPVKL